MVDYLNHVILRQFKNWMLPIAMIVGGVFYPFVSSLSFLTPYLIFLMLLVPYCKLSFDDMRITRLHVILLGFRYSGVSRCSGSSRCSIRCWPRALSSA